MVMVLLISGAPATRKGAAVSGTVAGSSLDAKGAAGISSSGIASLSLELFSVSSGIDVSSVVDGSGSLSVVTGVSSCAKTGCNPENVVLPQTMHVARTKVNIRFVKLRIYTLSYLYQLL